MCPAFQSHFRIIAWAGLPLMDDLARAHRVPRSTQATPLVLNHIEPATKIKIKWDQSREGGVAPVIFRDSTRTADGSSFFSARIRRFMQLWSRDRALSMLAHGRSRFPAHAPIGQPRRPRVGLTNSVRAESDRVACLCLSATVHICNPRMSRAARPDVASASRRSSLEPANA